jgi:hypothetical protein
MRSIIKSAIRIIVIFIAIKTMISFINNLVITLRNYNFKVSDQYAWLEIGIYSLAFLFGIFILWIIWWKAGAIARLLAGDIDDNRLVVDTSYLNLFRLVLMIIGIYLLVTGIPSVLSMIGYHFRLTALNEDIIRSNIEQANELKYWITPVVSVIIGLGLIFGLKKYWGKFNNIRKEKKNMIYLSRPFSITKITLEGFDPEKSYPVLAINMDQYPDKSPEQEELISEDTELPNYKEMAFFLVGDDKGEFAWIAEDECRLAPLKE